MFIHLGGETMLPLRDLVVIVNAENALGAHSTREFLQMAREEGFVRELDGANFKSIVVTDRTVYLSPIAALTLKRRAGFTASLG